MNVAHSFLPLWILPMMTAVAAFVCGAMIALAPRAAAAHLGGGAYSRGSTLALVARVVLAVAAIGALVALAIASYSLFKGPSLLTIGPRLARVGSFDATLSLHLTPTVATLVAVVLVGAIAFAAGAPPDTGPGEMAIAALVTTGAIEAALAEGFAGLVAGACVVALGVAAIAGATSSARGGRSAAAALAAPLGAVIAAAVLSWSLAGKFLDERRFLSDYKPRFVAVTVAPGQEARGLPLDAKPTPAELSMISPPGARVYIGVADERQLTPNYPPTAVVPFWGLEVPPGVQKIAVDAGGGTIIGGDGHDVALVDAVRVLPGARIVVKPVGPTTSFLEIADQAGAPDAPLAARKIAGVPVLDLAAAALLLGLLGLAAAIGHAGPRSATGAAIAGLGGASVATACALRLGPVLGAAGGVAHVVALAVGIFAVWCVIVATRARSFGGIVARLSGAWTALAALGVTFPATAAGITLAGAAVAAIGLAVAVERLADPLKNGAHPTVSATIRPAILAIGVGSVLGATAAAAGSLLRGGPLGVATGVTAVVTAAVGAFVVARASTFMAVVELVPADVIDPPRKSKKGKKRAAPAIDAPALVPKVVDKPSFPLPTSAVALAATGALSGVTGALWLARGLGVDGSMPLQIGVAAAVFVASAALAWRARQVDDDPKRREAWAADEGRLASIANPSESPRGAIVSAVVSGIRAVDAALRWPFDKLAGTPRPSRPKRAEGAEA